MMHTTTEAPRPPDDETRRVVRAMFDAALQTEGWTAETLLAELAARGVSKAMYDRAIKDGAPVPEDVCSALAAISIMGLPPRPVERVHIPNLADIRKQLEWMVEPARGAYDDALIEIAWSNVAGAPDRARLFALDELDEAIEFAAAKNMAGSNCYVGAALRLPDTPRDRRSGASAFYVATAVPIDIDTNYDSVRLRMAAACDDGLVVTTGLTPERRSQHWARLVEPSDDGMEFEHAFTALVSHTGADQGVHDRARLMRLGGTVSYPNADKVARGYVTELTVVTVKADARRTDITTLKALDPLARPGAKFDASNRPKGQGVERAGILGTGPVVNGRERWFCDILLEQIRLYQSLRNADPSPGDLWDAAWLVFSDPAETNNEDGRWTGGEGLQMLKKRVPYTLRRLRDGHLARWGLYSRETGTGREQAEQVQANREATRGPVYAAGVDPREGWPEPDPRLLNGGARPAPPFPLSTLEPLAEYIGDLAAAKDGPPDYLALALLTTAAGVVGGTRAVQLRPNWIEPCILWGLLVGNPSTGKSQPLEALKRAVRAIEPDDAPDFEDAHRAWQTKAATAKEVEARWVVDVKKAVNEDRPPQMRPSDADAPPEPLRPRILIGSATVEKLGLLFAAFPRGLLLHMDEGAAWFGNFGKYGGDGDAAFYLSAFSGIGTTVDRVKEGGSVAPDRALLSACVGIQPERLNELLFKGRADDGLVPRFLPVWPDPVPPRWNTPPVDERRLEGLLRQLRTLKPTTDITGSAAPVVMPLAPDIVEVFADWWTEAKHKAQGASGLMAGFLGKGLGVAGRLALVIELLTWAHTGGPEPTTVSSRSVAAALTLFETYFVPMAARVYGDAARPPAERAAVVLLKAVRARNARTLNKREVYREWGLAGLTDPATVGAALAVLEEGDCVKAVPATGARGGRPPGDYQVNPRLLDIIS